MLEDPFASLKDQFPRSREAQSVIVDETVIPRHVLGKERLNKEVNRLAELASRFEISSHFHEPRQFAESELEAKELIEKAILEMEEALKGFKTSLPNTVLSLR